MMQFCFRLQFGFVVGAILLLPLVFSNGLVLQYELPKILLFRGLVSAAFFLFCIRLRRGAAPQIVAFFRLLLKERKYRFLLVFLVLAILWNGVVYIFSPNQITTLWGSYHKRFGLYTIFHLGVFGLLTLDLLLHCEIDRRFFLLLPVPLFVNFYFSFSPHFTAPGGRVVGTFGQANFLAGYSLLLLPVLLQQHSVATRRLFRGWHLLGALSALALIVRSGSRMSLFLAAIVVVTYVFYLVRRVSFSRSWFVFAALLLLGVAFYETGFRSVERMLAFDMDASPRLKFWRAAYHLILERPVFGYGYDVAGFVFPAALQAGGMSPSVLVDRAHNEFLDIMLNVGLPGFLLFFGFHAVLLRLVLKTGRKSEMWGALAVVVLFWARSLVNVNGVCNYILYVCALAVIVRGAFSVPLSRVEFVSEVGAGHFSFKRAGLALAGCCLFVNVGFNFLGYAGDRSFKRFLHGGGLEFGRGAALFSPFQEKYRSELLRKKLDSDGRFDLHGVVPGRFLEQELFSPGLGVQLERYFRKFGGGLDGMRLR